MAIHHLKLIDRYAVANNTVALVFEKPPGFHFTSGQYGGFTLINPSETDAGGPTRRFSLLSAPDEPHIMIATRVQPSAYKRILLNLPLGSAVKFAGPTGNFTLHESTAIPAVFIAGGIGIVPFYSMLKHAKRQASSLPCYLFYGNQSRDDAAFLAELTTLAATYPALHFIPTLAKPDANWQGETGWMNADLIQQYLPDIMTPFYYICGSPVMVTTLQETLAEMGIDEDRIRVEDFPGY